MIAAPAKKKILLVDDEEVSRYLVRQLLPRLQDPECVDIEHPKQKQIYPAKSCPRAVVQKRTRLARCCMFSKTHQGENQRQRYTPQQGRHVFTRFVAVRHCGQYCFELDFGSHRLRRFLVSF